MKPIRVLHVVVTMNSGGIENMIMNLYRSIDRQKIQFDFLVHTNKQSFFDDEILKLGGNIHRIIPLRTNNLFKYKSKLNKFFKNEEYSIVHSHISVWSYFVLSVAKKNKVPIRIAHSHESHDSIWDHRLNRIPMIISLKKVINRTLTHRFACGKDAGKWLFGKREFTVVNNAIDCSKFVYDSAKALTIKKQLQLTNQFVIGHVGNFSYPKNYPFIINVFKQIKVLHANSKLVLIGGGQLESEVKVLAESLGVIDDILFLGIRKDVNDYLNTMDVFLFPSFYEGLGMVLVEAQCNGIPILMTETLPQEAEMTNLITRKSLKDSAS